MAITMVAAMLMNVSSKNRITLLSRNTTQGELDIPKIALPMKSTTSHRPHQVLNIACMPRSGRGRGRCRAAPHPR